MSVSKPAKFEEPSFPLFRRRLCRRSAGKRLNMRVPASCFSADEVNTAFGKPKPDLATLGRGNWMISGCSSVENTVCLVNRWHLRVSRAP